MIFHKYMRDVVMKIKQNNELIFLCHYCGEIQKAKTICVNYYQ